ncbi:MAG: methylated-DNA--[protein]-cysteine S-methyltransferase [Candidatus Eremiobacteraeota bacterium]|nr:methylated-DNA--[protein]-cysteine S-methyltransferase [Candidatus Eremiobacteraeota bacterium]
MLRLLQRQYSSDTSFVYARETSNARRALERYFSGNPRSIESVRTRTQGTLFQRKVWEVLRTVPVGQTTTYGAVAERIGWPTAYRAVGAAIGTNPIGIVIPCHRVIGANGSLTGYAGGIRRKQWLLQHEAAR